LKGKGKKIGIRLTVICSGKKDGCEKEKAKEFSRGYDFSIHRRR
jgi:hypothetical protein